jgi:hypothetical protein
MRGRNEPEPLSNVLKSILSRLGVSDLGTWQRIQDDWAQIAGSPWDVQSRPLALNGRTLVVEAVTPAAIALLRYGLGGLKQRLTEALGPGVVDEVSLRAPGPRARR